MARTYEFVKGFRSSGMDAQEVGESLSKIVEKYDRELWPEKTVAAARPKKSPIHKYFEWDDSTAATEYRLNQARRLHGAVLVVKKTESGEDVKERAFVHIRESNKPSPYRDVEDVLSDESWRESMIHQAVKDLLRAKKRLERWQEFAEVCDQISEAARALEESRKAEAVA